MNQFYLNNIVGVPVSAEAGALAVYNAAIAFGEMVADDKLNVSNKVIMDKDPKEICFGEFGLWQLIEEIKDSEAKRQAYILLRADSPMEQYFPWGEDVEPLIEAEYKFEERDATNLAVVHKHHGLTLSFAFEDSFKTNKLVLTSQSPEYENLSLDNLYGSPDNNKHIKDVLLSREDVEVKKIEEIKQLGYFNSKVEKVFDKQSDAIQQSIVDAFKEAVKQGLLVPHAGNGNAVIKPNGELVRFEPYTKSKKIFEIAVYYPLALRIFIAEYNGELYVLDIKSKKELGDGGTKQNAALREAEKRFIDMCDGK